MEKTTNKDKTKQAERALLDSWHPHIKNAMDKLHNKFKSDTKFILTESDLKCWLFYFLQKEKTKKETFEVHTEVTHYPHSQTIQNEIKVKVQKYFFRDLTILDNSNVIENEELC